MHFFTGGKKKVEPVKVDVSAEAAGAIRNLRGEINKLDKRRLHLEGQVSEQDEKVREKVRAKDTKSAKMALVRRNNLNKQLEVLDNQMITLETQVMNLESQSTNITAVQAMEQAMKAQQLISKAIDVDKVEDIFENIAELEQGSAEIADAFKLNAENAQGDMDFDTEIERIEAELLEQDLLKAKVPSAPIPAYSPAQASTANSTPAVETKAAAPSLSAEEDKELAQLQAQLQFA